MLLHLHAPVPDVRLPARVRGRVVACHRQLHALVGLQVSALNFRLAGRGVSLVVRVYSYGFSTAEGKKY